MMHITKKSRAGLQALLDPGLNHGAAGISLPGSLSAGIGSLPTFEPITEELSADWLRAVVWVGFQPTPLTWIGGGCSPGSRCLTSQSLRLGGRVPPNTTGGCFMCFICMVSPNTEGPLYALFIDEAVEAPRVQVTFPRSPTL